MRKLSVLFLILLLLSSAALSEGADNELFYACDFSGGLSGWQTRGEGTTLSAEDGMLLVSGRAKKSDAPAITLPMEEGKIYTFSMRVTQEVKTSVEFSMSLEIVKAGHKSFVKLAGGKASRGEWITLTGEWQAEAAESCTLFVSTVGSADASFSIDDVTVNVTDPFKLTVTEWEGELPVLKDIYAGKFDIGTCVSGMDVRNGDRAALVASQYTIITPENELKPDYVLDVATSRRLAKSDDTAVAVHFSSAKPILDFAKKNGLKVHGHVLVWHSQTPEEFFHVGYDRKNEYVTREVMLARLENYIREVFAYFDENYPGLVVSWDVANECVSDGSASLRDSNWTRVVGQDFVERAFEFADRYAPADVLLCYNDYSTPYEPKQTGIVNLLTRLVAEGHIDGYGFQSHYAVDDPDVEAVASAFERIAALGLRLRVSELDMKIKADTDLNRAAQALRYQELMRLYLSYAGQMEAVQVWGVCDGTSWIRESYPLLFDARLQPKPAFFSVAQAIE